MKDLTTARIRTAWIIALTTDAIQIGILPIARRESRMFEPKHSIDNSESVTPMAAA